MAPPEGLEGARRVCRLRRRGRRGALWASRGVRALGGAEVLGGGCVRNCMCDFCLFLEREF